MIEFNLDGTIITANANFLATMGYELADVQGKHHSMFVEPAYVSSAEYGEFWDRPNTSVSARAARKSGSKRPTTRSWMRLESPIR